MNATIRVLKILFLKFFYNRRGCSLSFFSSSSNYVLSLTRTCEEYFFYINRLGNMSTSVESLGLF